jgi:hypothetical protein
MKSGATRDYDDENTAEGASERMKSGRELEGMLAVRTLGRRGRWSDRRAHLRCLGELSLCVNERGRRERSSRERAARLCRGATACCSRARRVARPSDTRAGAAANAAGGRAGKQHPAGRRAAAVPSAASSSSSRQGARGGRPAQHQGSRCDASRHNTHIMRSAAAADAPPRRGARRGSRLARRHAICVCGTAAASGMASRGPPPHPPAPPGLAQAAAAPAPLGAVRKI